MDQHDLLLRIAPCQIFQAERIRIRQIVRADGTLAMWGYGIEPPEGDGFVSVSAGSIHHLALKADGSIVAWGNNSFGACDVPAIYDFIDIAAGGAYSLAMMGRCD